MRSPSGGVIRIPQSSYSCAFVSIRGPMVFLRPLGISARCVQNHWATNGHECTRIKKERLNEVKGKSAIDCSAMRQNAWKWPLYGLAATVNLGALQRDA